MLPIRDDIRSSSVPIINGLLIAVNALVFFLMLTMSGGEIQRFTYSFGLVPARLNLVQPQLFLSFVTHMFIHGGWMHFLSNMWTLFIFGDNVEDRLGSMAYLLFYLVGGFAAAVAQTLVDPNSSVPMIGASGAIAAVMGAYMAYYPRARVITWVPLFFLGWFARIPAVLYLGVWFVSQIMSGLSDLSGGMVSGVAWWAHIGGFVVGYVLALILGKRGEKKRWYPDEYRPW